MKSAWEIKGIKEFSKLEKDIEADVCIVGGGLVGMWSAYLLAQEGKKVALIEKDQLGRAATLYTTGFVTQVIDTSASGLIEMFGLKQAGLTWQAGADAIRQISDFVDENHTECEFERLPLSIIAKDERQYDKLSEEGSAIRKIGFETNLNHKPLEGFNNAGSLEVPDQAKYHPMKFFKALTEAAAKLGVEIFESTEAVEVSGKSPVIVTTKDKHHIRAADVIIATYEPLNNPKPTHFKKGMYVSYVYELELPRGAMPAMMCVDQHNPYHYFRVDDLGTKVRMIIGGEDHRAELKFEESKSFRALKGFIDETFPDVSHKVETRWQGGILEPSDGLPLIGEHAPHQYLACAFSGNGMTYSAITGRILTDLIMGRGSIYANLYSPLRQMKPKAILHKFRDYGGEFFGGAVKNLFK